MLGTAKRFKLLYCSSRSPRGQTPQCITGATGAGTRVLLRQGAFEKLSQIETEFPDSEDVDVEIDCTVDVPKK